MDNSFFMNEDILWDYLDGLLSDEDRRKADAYMSLHPEWKAKLDVLQQEKKALFAIPMERPDRGFADRVMAAWTAEHMQQTALARPAKKHDWILYAIAGAFTLFILTPVVLMILAAVQMAPVDLPAVSVPALPVISWSQVFNHPAMQVGLAAAMGLLLVVAIEKYLHQKQVTEHLKS